jgi:hypothetical protein
MLRAGYVSKGVGCVINIKKVFEFDSRYIKLIMNKIDGLDLLE